MKRLDINIRDPFIVVEDDTYYMFGTSMNENHFLCYESKNLENFYKVHYAYRKEDSFWADSDYWAPEVHKYQDKYYLFASFKSKDRARGTQVFFSNKITGPYRPLTEYPYTPPNWECLDGTLYVEDGIPYSIFAHEWVQIGDGTMCLVELSKDLKEVKSEPQVILRASEGPWVRAYTEGSYVTDGPFIHKLSDGSLIMIWSSFSESGYSIGQAKSVNGIKGPWVHLEETLYEKDGGHGMIFKDLKGRLILSLHMPNSLGLERPYFFEIEEAGGQLQLTNPINIRDNTM